MFVHSMNTGTADPMAVGTASIACHHNFVIDYLTIPKRNRVLD